MSWMKKRGHAANQVPAQQPPQVQMYNPNQLTSQNWQTQPNNWYQDNNPVQNNVTNQGQQANYWQQPQFNQFQQYNQQVPQQAQFYQENSVPASTYEQKFLGNEQNNDPNYPKNPPQNTYLSNDQEQTSYQQNYAGNQPEFEQKYLANETPQVPPVLNQQKSYETQNNPQVPSDTWNWGWGDEDNNSTPQYTQDNLKSSFKQDDTWNWKVEEPPPPPPVEEKPNVSPLENKEIADLNPAIKRRIKSETMTPQWSIESQNSQASSDDIPQTSESSEPQLESLENKEVISKAEINLEVPPDNSEQPENYEVAPINDRNQYLETGQLSDDNAGNYPSFTRMIVGENNQVDEPPPGLSRMVLGETEPVSFSRMVPGESSSPEATRFNDYEPETVNTNQQSRSETIGADTPPAMNRSETLGSNSSTENRRRDSIEGQQIVDDLSNAVRNLNVTEKPSDAVPEHATTDSDGERPVSSVDRRDKRYKERPRDYSPDYGRDKKTGRRYRDRYYEDDTDYLSDRERDRRREEYDRKYSSLRREKDRRRRDGGEYRDPRRDYDYGRYDPHYDDPRRSRPSSRSDSIQESFTQERGSDRDHRRHRDRDRDHRRPRGDTFNPYMRGYGGYGPYDPYMQYQYQYLENMRITNPQRYAEWYRKYYQQQVNPQQPTGYGMEDKTSIHSGRSSTNDEIAKERYLRQSYYRQDNYSHLGGYYDPHSLSANFQSINESSVSQPYDLTDSSLQYDQASQRATPAKFANAHCKASIASGKILKFLPNYAIDGQAPTIEINQIFDEISLDPELQELQTFPGPLIKGVTRKKTIIEYCESKINNLPDDLSDPDAYVLMWELLILLLRQNGMVVGTDISELLMKDRRVEGLRPASVASNTSSTMEINNITQDGVNNSSGGAILKEEFITNKFREYLIYGAGKEALEWAMKNNLWGHALFLASKLDKRTYANVMMRFANGLPLNDPLQTLYQLLSGKLPASVTSVSDEKWGDWRPHLAMILSNTTQRPELVRKAITTLADTLTTRGSLYAAQFCYLMAEMEFSRYGTEGARLVLLGADHTKPFLQFATNEAIHMTEIYEFACSLNDASFIIPEFQPYKYLLATRLSDYGFLECALSYLEKCSGALIHLITNNPAAVSSSIIEKVCDLSDRLKFNDPMGELDENDEDIIDLNTSRPDNTWLKDLKACLDNINAGFTTSVEQNQFNQPQVSNYEESYVQDPWQNQVNEQNNWQPQEPNVIQQEDIVTDPMNVYGEVQDQSWQQPSQPWENSQIIESYNSQGLPEQQQQAQSNDYWNSAPTELESKKKKPAEVSKPVDSSCILRKRLPVPSKNNDVKPLYTKPKTKSTLSLFVKKNKSAEDIDACNLELESKPAVKSQLIRTKSSTKLITIKNEAKITKYNTFEVKGRKKLMKFKSLDEQDLPKSIKYYDTKSNITISAQDFNSEFKLSKFRRGRNDVITDTVDAWARKSSKSVFSNLRHSLFHKSGSGVGERDVVYKPLVFGGTFPIDAPTNEPQNESKVIKINKAAKFREYGPAKSFDIDLPI